MSERDMVAFRERALTVLSAAARAADDASGPEKALRHLTDGMFDLLGDRDAHNRPGALKDGERQFFVAGFFMITPDRQRHVLIAEQGFPAEQHRLRIPLHLGHPGWMVEHQVPLILANTDDHAEFEQILKTSRMGSALYAPMFWQGALLGQFIMAGQARNTMSQPDLDVLVAAANVAAATYIAHDGPAWFAELANGLA